MPAVGQGAFVCFLRPQGDFVYFVEFLSPLPSVPRQSSAFISSLRSHPRADLAPCEGSGLQALGFGHQGFDGLADGGAQGIPVRMVGGVDGCTRNDGEATGPDVHAA